VAPSVEALPWQRRTRRRRTRQVSVLVAQTAEVRGSVADLLAGGGRRWWRGRDPTGRFPTLAGRVQT